MPPETTYDPDADAVYVALADARPHEGAEVAPGVVLDFDAEGRLVGIDIANARTTLAPGDWSKARPPSAKPRHAAE
jgi:uncharacterized protein YuzE